jgi:hypothetical protein
MVSAAGLYLSFIKFSNLPMTLVLLMAYGIKVFKGKPQMFRELVFYAGLIGGLMAIYLWKAEILVSHKNLQNGSSFNLVHLPGNLFFYARTLLGGQTHYLWYQEKLLSPLVALLSLVGILYGLSRKKFRYMSSVFLAMVLGQVLFMSTFLSADARYVSPLLLGVVLGVGMLMSALKPRAQYVAGALCLGAYLFIPTFSQSQEPYVITLKKQVGLNYLHPETPWNYVAVQEMNAFVAQRHKQKPDAKIYIGTFLPPHYVELFAQGFTPIPLTRDQEFFSSTAPFPDYDGLLSEAEVYVSQAYQSNNQSAWPSAFHGILDAYEHKIVHTGCLKTCNIYKLEKRMKR